MEEEIWGVMIQGYGPVLGRPVIEADNLVALRDPRQLVPMRADDGKSIRYELHTIIGEPKRLNFQDYYASYEVVNDNLLRVYHESVTGLKLAPSGLKLV